MSGSALPTTIESTFPGANLGFPQPLLAVAAGVIFVSLPYLSRTLQRLIESLLVLVVVIGFVHGAGLPFSLLASVIVGWGAAAVAHLAFGTPLGVPSSDEVVATLDDLDSTPSMCPPSRTSSGDSPGSPQPTRIMDRSASRSTAATLGRASCSGSSTGRSPTGGTAPRSPGPAFSRSSTRRT